MSVTISNKLPKDDTNGLAHLEARLAANTDEAIVVVGIIRTDRITNVPHDSDNPRIVTTALLHVEALGEQDGPKVEKILRDVYQARTGKKELPFEDDADDADAED